MIKKRIFSHIDGRQYAKSQNGKFSKKNGICHQLPFTMMLLHAKQVNYYGPAQIMNIY